MSKEYPAVVGRLVLVGDKVYSIDYDQLEVQIVPEACPVHYLETAYVTMETYIHTIRDQDDRPLEVNIDWMLLVPQICRIIGDGTPRCRLCLEEPERE